MARVVLLYDLDCPNVPLARTNLRQALAQAGMPAEWSEVDRAAADTPAEWRGFGSPTVLVDGRDAGGLTATAHGATCRLYRQAGVPTGAPPVEMLAAALSWAPPASGTSDP